MLRLKTPINISIVKSLVIRFIYDKIELNGFIYGEEDREFDEALLRNPHLLTIVNADHHKFNSFGFYIEVEYSMISSKQSYIALIRYSDYIQMDRDLKLRDILS